MVGPDRPGLRRPCASSRREAIAGTPGPAPSGGSVALTVSAADTLGHVLAYEWLHLLYHLPPGRVARCVPFMAALRRHHALHHSPQLQRFNLNVTLPLWDLVHGTLWRPARGALDTRGGVG